MENTLKQNMNLQMEQWEIDLRERLEREIPHGAYHFPGPPDVYTGKGGYINIMVEFERECRKMIKPVDPKVIEEFKSKTKDHIPKMTEQELRDLIKKECERFFR